MKSKNLELKSIKELLDKNFFIPSYQRGYRWEERQVLDLLEDIHEFSRKKERSELKPKEFYCLQPIVVKRESEHYVVIDGQQRLTTIFIILKFLERKIEDDFYIDSFYSLTYQTRDKENSSSHEFLNNINNIKEVNSQNIDFYYMSRAYLTVKSWFIQNRINKGDFLNILLKDDIQYANNIRVIWYEVEENEVDIFTRLNMGKIPLTNAELIKALLLIDRSKQKSNEKILLASTWDSIEYRLQNDNFFAFIHAVEYQKATRIEFIFDLMASEFKFKIENLRKDDEKKSYYLFDRLIHDVDEFKKEFDIKDEKYQAYDERVTFLWDKIKTYYRIFEELYTDNTYYHLVGFLTNNGTNIKDIISKFKMQDKNDFLDYLKTEIYQKIKHKKSKKLEELEYGKDSTNIERILFLFNVVLTMESGYGRYPFDLHKKEHWSLEHIHPQNPESLKEEEKQELLNSYKVYMTKERKKEIEEIIQNQEISKISDLLEKILDENGDNQALHLLSNMTLLSKEKNSSLSNGLFIQKREQIISWDRAGEFIPIGTKNLFLKYFTNTPKDLEKWNKGDREDYLKAIESTLKVYIGEENE
jgi:uncharacterized protein with ParB-like and HNH nuclease domain